MTRLEELAASLLVLALIGLLFGIVASQGLDDQERRLEQQRIERDSGDCDTDSDCQEKYPCGTWYGNPIYGEDMTEQQKQEIFELCLDGQEGREP